MKKRGKNEERALLAVLTLLQKLEPKEILKLIKEKEKKEKVLQSNLIPVSLFSASSLSSLEAMTIYLRENKALKFSEMEKILFRNQIMLSTTYRNAKKKYTKDLQLPDSKYFLPCTIFANKKLSVLENIVFYMKQEYHLQNNQISKLLNKDPRTIWTVLYRIKEKKVKA